MHECRKIFVHFVDYIIYNSYICYQKTFLTNYITQLWKK